MERYRKRPLVIEAVQFTGDVGTPEIVALGLDSGQDAVTGRDYLIVPTLEGPLRASPGDWIIRGLRGELYPIKPDLFERTYDKVGEDE